MAIILDADVIIRGEKGKFDLREWVAKRPDDSFELAAITVAELWHGVERAATTRQRGTRESYLRTIIGVLPVIPFTEHTAYLHARLWARLEAAGTMIGYHNLIVAATALERGSSIATFNTRHFACIPEITIVEPE